MVDRCQQLYLPRVQHVLRVERYILTKTIATSNIALVDDLVNVYFGNIEVAIFIISLVRMVFTALNKIFASTNITAITVKQRLKRKHSRAIIQTLII